MDKLIDLRTFVPAALSGIIGALSAGGLLIWQGGHKDAMLTDHDKRIAQLEARVDGQAGALNEIKVTLARVDERIIFLVQNLPTFAPASTRGSH